MEALEFSTTIERGVIQLPKQFEAYDNAYVRIIILADKPRDVSQKKERLKRVLEKMQQTDIFRNVTNPVDWQKQLRDEWE